MKKVLNIFLIIVLMIPFLTVPIKIEAQTLRELKEELEKTKQELKNQQAQEKLNQEQINKINANINNINATIKQIGDDMIRLSEEIAAAEIEIQEKDAQIKEVVNFLQVSSGESEYMEYIFGAKDFTDFIYRMSITEQMTDYNDRLIDEANTLIENNKKKQVELTNKEKELKNKQEELSKELAKVKADLSKIYDIFVDLEESIKVQESTVKLYEQDLKCGLDEDTDACLERILRENLEAALKSAIFTRPLTSGYISSNYGNRCFWLNGVWTCDFHTGIDIGAPLGTPVYSTSVGVVTAITPRYHCGGNMVFIHHWIDGRTYTSLYMHLYQVNVKVGDVVSGNTVIGTVGGDPGVTWWDSCSTGSHLHFTLLNGLVGDDYVAWSNGFYASLIDPRTRVNFPAYGSSFYNRTSKY